MGGPHFLHPDTGSYDLADGRMLLVLDRKPEDISAGDDVVVRGRGVTVIVEVVSSAD